VFPEVEKLDISLSKGRGGSFEITLFKAETGENFHLWSKSETKSFPDAESVVSVVRHHLLSTPTSEDSNLNFAASDIPKVIAALKPTPRKRISKK